MGAMSDDLAEFMLGRVAVTARSHGKRWHFRHSTLDWTASKKTEVLNNVRTGLNWWTSLLATKSSVHTLEWVIDTTYIDNPVNTKYEPITRISNEYVNWVPDFLNASGHNESSDLETNIREFNNAQRLKLATGWRSQSLSSIHRRGRILP